ncbi:winged helix DNA-binding protein [Streptomyces finlayi]|uniref:Winged helix DNA-binding protein n=1 Tax=Streptomyces finlayi TaxID=67296 RepID=A0A7G7BE38_9ACTN|nr:winged helix DNA-binding protein [Streptomyces finlayi]QNE73603.1 winged helix DNA-binding protein [Streptomyces finlayi]
MPSTVTVNGQIIGQAHYATRAVLERLLAGSGTTFHQCVALNATAGDGGTTGRAELVARLTGTLKTDRATAEAALGELTGAGLLEETPGDDGAHLALTEAGRARQAAIRTGTAAIAERLYAGLPAEELAAAGRVLTELTVRANAVLADPV